MEVSVVMGMLIGVGVSVGALVDVGASQDDIENRTMMAKAMPTKHIQKPFLLSIQFMISLLCW